MRRECEICLEVVPMYYILTELSGGAKKHINDSAASLLQSSSLVCNAHDQRPLYTDTTGYVIAIHRLWNMMHLDRAAHFLCSDRF